MLSKSLVMLDPLPVHWRIPQTEDCGEHSLWSSTLPSPPSPTVLRLTGGRQVALQEGYDDLTVAAVTFPTGASAEAPCEVGAAHLVEHLMVSSLKQQCRSQNVSLFIRGSTSFWTTTYFFAAHVRNSAAVAGVLASLVAPLHLSEELVRLEKSIAVDELSRLVHRTKQEVQLRLLGDAFGPRFAVPIAGAANTVVSLSADGLKRFQERYNLADAGIAIVSTAPPSAFTDNAHLAASRPLREDATHTELGTSVLQGGRDAARTRFSSMQPRRRPSSPARFHQLGFRLPPPGHPGRAELERLRMIARLADAPPAHGIAQYQVDILDAGPSTGLLILTPAKLSPFVQSQGQALRAARKSMHGIIDGFPLEEYKAQAERLLLDWRKDQLLPEIRAVTLSRSLLLGGWSVADVAAQRCAQVSRGDVAAAIDCVISEDNLLTSNTKRPRGASVREPKAGKRRCADESARGRPIQSIVPCPPRASHLPPPVISVATFHPARGLSAAAILFEGGSSREPTELNGISSVVVEAVAQRIRSEVLPKPVVVKSVALRDATAILIEGVTPAMPELIRASMAQAWSHGLREPEFESGKRTILLMNRQLPANREAHVTSLALQHVFQGTPYCMPESGTPETVGALRHAESSRWGLKIAGSAAVVSIVGEASTQCIERLRVFLDNMQRDASPDVSNDTPFRCSPPPAPVLLSSEGPLRNVSCLAFPVPEIAAPSYPAVQLLATTIAGAFSTKPIVRAKARASAGVYGISSGCTLNRCANALWIRWDCTAERNTEVKRLVVDLLKDLPSLLGKERIGDLRRSWGIQHRLAHQSQSRVGLLKGVYAMSGVAPDRIATRETAPARATMKQLQAVARYYISSRVEEHHAIRQEVA